MNVTNLDCKTMMNPSRPFRQPVAPPWLAPLPPDPPMTSAFWVAMNVRDRLSDLQHTLALAKAMYDFEFPFLFFIFLGLALGFVCLFRKRW